MKPDQLFKWVRRYWATGLLLCAWLLPALACSLFQPQHSLPMAQRTPKPPTSADLLPVPGTFLPGEAQPTALATSGPAEGSPGEQPLITGPSLRSLAERRGFNIGVAVGTAFLSGDPNYAFLVASQFNALAPENELKWEMIHPQRDRYNFKRADAILAFAQAHGMQVYGHSLVWDNQLPAWLTEGEFTHQEWLAILHDHIATVVGHYRGQIAAWDVVNEAFTEEGTFRNTIWLQKIGPQYIALAFQWAHEADPQAALYYNDHAGEGMNRKSQAIYALAQGLLQAGVPIDGIGMQMHVWLNGAPSPQELAENMQRLADLGLRVQVTEMDVRVQYSQLPTDQKLEQQGHRYAEILDTCLQASNCDALVVWGLTDKVSWIPGYTGHPDAPVLLDEQGQPKPAFEAVRSALASQANP